MATETKRIRTRQGTLANRPTLGIGEMGFSTDTKELHIGSSVGNLRVLGDYITPEMFGAVGDGVSNDTIPLQACINSGHPLIKFTAGKSYAITTVNLPTTGGLEIDGNNCSIIPLGNPAYVIGIPSTDVIANRDTVVKNLFCDDDCTDFIYISGGRIGPITITNIRHRLGVITSVVHFRNTSAVYQPGVLRIRGIFSFPLNTVVDNAKYLIKFSAPVGCLGFDTIEIDDLGIWTGVTGGRAIYCDTTAVWFAIGMSKIRKVFAFQNAAAGTILAIEGKFDRCTFSDIYLETLKLTGLCLGDYLSCCEVINAGVFCSDPAAICEVVNGDLYSTQIVYPWVNRNGAYPYNAGVYHIVHTSGASFGNTVIMDSRDMVNAVSLGGARDVGLCASPIFDKIDTRTTLNMTDYDWAITSGADDANWGISAVSAGGNSIRMNYAIDITNPRMCGIWSTGGVYAGPVLYCNTYANVYVYNNLGLGTEVYGAGGTSVLAIKNGTAPGAHVDDEIQLYSKDASTGGATLGIETEAAVEAIGTFTPSNKIKIWVNGAEYWVQLDAV